ncbi:MAG: hypothetical protein G01um1014106_31 [Parcubacteria group bacterium Gr01-1014_106]|nr:MAG: hypothetical protein G01um1014106_31 [Parcubacteria group bacterium Gr01-1014_106]
MLEDVVRPQFSHTHITMIAVPASSRSPVAGSDPPRAQRAEGGSLPPIRTMADDLADAARGGLTGTGPLPPAAAGTAPALSTAQPRQVVGLPADARPRRRIVPVLLLVLPLVVLVGVGVWVAIRLLPRSSGTVADSIPSEAQAFVSVRSGDAQASTLLPGFFATMNGLQAGQVAGASDITYLLLPGPSAAEPVPAILVRGIPTVDLSASPALGLASVSEGVLITDSTNLGRVRAFSGSTWGRERAFQRALHGLPAQPPILMAARPGVLATLLQPFFSHPLSHDASLVMAIVPSGEGGSASVVARVDAPSSAQQNASSSAGVTGIRLAATLPHTVMMAMEYPLRSLADVLTSERIPSGLRPVAQALQERSDAFGNLLQSFEGTAILGTLPTDTAGVRDVVALLTLKPGGTDTQSSLRVLEAAGPAFGPYLTGSAFADAAFTEATYRDVAVRYMNFGSPTRALDYAVVDDLLIIATSRSAMHAVLDALQEAVPTLATVETFRVLAETVDQSAWSFFRGSTALQNELPPAYHSMSAVLDGLVLRPVNDGLYTGAILLREPPPPSATDIPASPTPAPVLPL